MDPIALIVSALVAGLSSGLTDSVKNTIQDLLKALRSKLSKKDAVKVAIDKIEADPNSEPDQEFLKAELLKTDIDKELIELSQQILAKIDPKGAQSGKYSVSIENSQGVVIGDGSTVSMTFGNNKKSKKK